MTGENRPDENSLYRLIEFQPIWKRYAVVENGERYHVIRILIPQTSEDFLSPLLAAEEWASWLNPIESNESIPHIVRVVPHAEGVDVFTRMPLGISLKTLLHRVGPLRVPFVASILKTLVDALGTFHQGGHVHTGLCLDSVVIDDQGHLTLLDMGLRETLERCRGPISFPNPAWGSLYSEPSTTAPELLNGCKELSPLMDIFSLSSMTFHMLTGSTAYVGGDNLEVYSLIKAGKTPEIEKYRRDLGPSLSQALVRGLSPQPDRRFQEAHELLEAVFGKSERLDPLVDTASFYKNSLNDWFLDASFKTIREPSLLSPLARNLLETGAGAEHQKIAVEMAFETMRTTRRVRERGGSMARYLSGAALVFSLLGFALLYYFLHR